MATKFCLLLLLSINLFMCSTKMTSQHAGEKTESLSHSDEAAAALHFAKSILKDNLRVRQHERLPSNYLDIQMIFETDNLISYTSYSNRLHPDKSAQSDYEGFILFVARYADPAGATYAFEELKKNTQIRIAELEGFAGLLVEQVQVFERIRQSGGMITQKGKYVFYLVETCASPLAGTNWQEYENLFLRSIADENEDLEILNADCEKDIFSLQKIKL